MDDGRSGSARHRPAIAVQGVSKLYTVFDSRRERVLGALLPGRRSGRQVAALQDISFEIARGEAVAIIGRNGSGKSTLLQILTGTLTPTTGNVEVNGRVAALLELGSGFNPEYTGRENAILNGLLLGFTRQDMLDRMAEIEAFAEIGAAIDQPTRTYSSGMVVRLAFAVQAMSEPDILIVDEALSVGDFFFQQKCFQHIAKLRKRGVTLLFVSHDMGAVRDHCGTGIMLRKGRVIFHGDNLTAVDRYLSEAVEVSVDAGAPSHISPAEPNIAQPGASLKIESPLWHDADGCLQISSVGIAGSDGKPTTAAYVGDTILLKVLVRWMKDGDHVAVTIRNKMNQVVSAFGTHTISTGDVGNRPLPNEHGYEFRIPCLLEAGEYVLKVTIARMQGPSSGVTIAETDWLGPIAMRWDYQQHTPPFFGMFGLPIEASRLV